MKKLKSISFTFLFLAFSISLFSQKTKLLHFETNKVLCLYSFLETATNAPGSSSSYKEYIEKELGGNLAFKVLRTRFSNIRRSDELKKESYPFNRHSSKTVVDLIWITCSNSLDINDLNNRLIGILSNRDHAELIAVLKEAEPFYDKLVWNKVQKQITRIENQLEPYGKKIEKLFLQISKFYGTEWNTSIPFKVMLYPIPLERGTTTATPKGNALICSFLTEQEDDYIGRLGVIIHEMCHILFDEQPLHLQNKIDRWFTESQSSFSKLAYSYIDEGLATAIGNGWAYREIHGEIDTMEWYNNEYINGFGHALFDGVSEYLAQGKTIDEAFINNAITLFGKTFPKSNSNIATLLNEVRIYANAEEKKDIDKIFGNLRNHFQIRSAWLSTPISDPKSVETFYEKQITKLFIIDHNNENTIQFLKEKYKLTKEFPHSKSFIFNHKDEVNQSTIFIINFTKLEDLNPLLTELKEMEFVEYGEVKIIK